MLNLRMRQGFWFLWGLEKKKHKMRQLIRRCATENLVFLLTLPLHCCLIVNSQKLYVTACCVKVTKQKCSMTLEYIHAESII